MADINPRYACYCAAHGSSSVNAMIAADQIEWPGGVMAGYILWVKRHVSDFAQSLTCHDAGKCFANGHLTERGHLRFNEWLKALYPDWTAVSLNGEEANSP